MTTHKEVECARVGSIVHAFVKFPDSLQVFKEHSIRADRLQLAHKRTTHGTIEINSIVKNVLHHTKSFSFIGFRFFFGEQCLSSNTVVCLALKIL